MGLGVAPFSWVSSRAWGGLAKLTWRVVNGQTRLAVGLAVGLFKKKFFLYKYFTIFIIFLTQNQTHKTQKKGTFFVNGVEYLYGYYLVDGIYPEWGVFVKSFTKHGTTDPKRLKFNRVQMAARKDVERAFGVLKKRWRIL
ncbi:putative harbinger transposase-derived protein [Helianthus annuus]|nr:putative harbinger transposase-derived protein [Helianthus annuus]KAJ0528546.1 putative harbinger transposase-derived protein [Helianthus annuus]